MLERFLVKTKIKLRIITDDILVQIAMSLFYLITFLL